MQLVSDLHSNGQDPNFPPFQNDLIEDTESVRGIVSQFPRRSKEARSLFERFSAALWTTPGPVVIPGGRRGSTFDRKAGVSPVEQFACEVGIQQVLGKEQRDHTMAPDFRQSLVGAQGYEEEAVMAVEPIFQHNGMPMRV